MTLDEILERHNLSQATLAHLVGVRPETVTRWRKGGMSASAQTKVDRVLGLLGDDWTTGKWLRDGRKAAGLTQVELSEQTGMTQNSVSRIERDLVCPELTTLARLQGVVGGLHLF